MRIIVVMIAVILAGFTLPEKKPLIESKEKVKATAIKEFNQSMTDPEGELHLFGVENNIKGEYHFKVTLGDRGKVISVFVISRKGADIPSQNKVKDAVKAFRFHFKLPKNKDYSFEHTFKF
ncbi:MAG: hypothetical protein L3J66_00895 [Bacteroidales bacterium]|nr:hypothetical protein [Bacteroidales bacterium]